MGGDLRGEPVGAERLGAEAETGLYRVAQEALSNARKHAGIREVRLGLALGKGKVRLEVEDRGRGFDPRVVPRAGGPGEGVGLAGMRVHSCHVRADIYPISHLLQSLCRRGARAYGCLSRRVYRGQRRRWPPRWSLQ